MHTAKVFFGCADIFFLPLPHSPSAPPHPLMADCTPSSPTPSKKLPMPDAPVKPKRKRTAILATYYYVDQTDGGENTRLFILLDTEGSREVYDALSNEEKRKKFSFERESSDFENSSDSGDEDYYDANPQHRLSPFFFWLGEGRGDFEKKLKKHNTSLYYRLRGVIGREDQWGDWEVYYADDGKKLAFHHPYHHIVMA